MLSVLELLQFSYAIYRRNIGLFLGYAAWILVPDAVILFFSSVLPEIHEGLLLSLEIVQFILELWLFVLFTLFTAHIIRKKKIELQKLTRYAFHLLPSVILIAFLTSIVQIVGFIFFIIPGILFSVWYVFSDLEVILSHKKGITAMTESRNLVRGKFLKVLWRLLAGGAVLLSIYLLFWTGLIELTEWMSHTPSADWNTQLVVASRTAEGIIDVLFLPIFTIFPAVLYLDLKSEKPKKEKV